MKEMFKAILPENKKLVKANKAQYAIKTSSPQAYQKYVVDGKQRRYAPKNYETISFS